MRGGTENIGVTHTHTHTQMQDTQMRCEQVTDINRAKAHKGHYGFREKKRAGDFHLVAS